MASGPSLPLPQPAALLPAAWPPATWTLAKRPTHGGRGHPRTGSARGASGVHSGSCHPSAPEIHLSASRVPPVCHEPQAGEQTNTICTRTFAVPTETCQNTYQPSPLPDPASAQRIPLGEIVVHWRWSRGDDLGWASWAAKATLPSLAEDGPGWAGWAARAAAPRLAADGLGWADCAAGAVSPCLAADGLGWAGWAAEQTRQASRKTVWAGRVGQPARPRRASPKASQLSMLGRQSDLAMPRRRRSWLGGLGG
jgi:hypothetical protein